MAQESRGGGVGEQGVAPADGGGPITGGTDPPESVDPVDLLEEHCPEEVPASDCHAIRVALATDASQYAERIVEELDQEMEVLGATHDVPGRRNCFDVLVDMDYAPETVANALTEPSVVRGATIVRVPVDDVDDTGDEDGQGAAEDDDGEGVLANTEAGGGDGEEVMANTEAGGDGGEAVWANTEAGGDDGGSDVPAGDTDVPATASSEETGNHPTFDQFKLETDPIGYDALVEKLESTSLPGEFDEGVDLQPIIEGDDGEADGEEATGETGGATDGDLDVPSLDGAGADDGGDADGPGEVANRSGDPDPGTVVEGLVSALEDDAITDEQRRTLVDALTDDSPPKTLLVKLDHLQREVDELAAYKEALEAFIDEYGSGEGLVDEVRATMQEFAADVEGVSEEVQRLGEAVAATDARLDDVDERVATVDDRVGAVDDVAATVDDHGARLAELDQLASDVDALGDVETRLESVRSDLDDLREAVEANDGAGEAVEERLASVEDDVADLDARVVALESETDGTVDDVERRLADVEQRLSEQEAWQQRFQQLFGGAGEPPGGEESTE